MRLRVLRIPKSIVIMVIVLTLYTSVKVTFMHLRNSTEDELHLPVKRLPHILSTNESSVRDHCAQSACRAVDCAALFEGHAGEQQHASRYMMFHPSAIPSDASIAVAAHNCSDFRAKYRYPAKSASKVEEDFQIAYSIVMHKDVTQMEKLLNAIYQPQNIYCIHIDRKADQYVHRAVKALTRCLDNVFVATKLENIVYAGFSRLKADINCMNDLLEKSSTWKYFINLVGQVFPLKTNRELVNILKIYNGANDVEGMPLWRAVATRTEVKWEENYSSVDSPVLVRHPEARNPPPPHNMTIVRGSAYAVLSRAAVNYTLHDPMARDLLDWSRYTYSPDEHYWATLNHLYINPQLTTPGGYHGLPDRKPWLVVYASWYPRDPCYGTIKRGVCIFGIKDLPQLAARHELFANKFYMNYEYLALDCLAEWLYNRSVSSLPSSYYFYRQLPFVVESWKTPLSNGWAVDSTGLDKQSQVHVA